MKSPRSGCSGSRPDDCCRPAGSESGANAGSDFVVIPAIDLKEGCCVRLRQGVASDKTVYSGDPVEVAMEWELQGAALLHVVDLDGAFLGQPVHTKLIGRLAQAVCIPVQAGGGLRTEDHIRELFDLGVWRAIVGTSACVAQEETASLLGAFADKLAVAIDARGGVVRVKGWTETASLDFLDVAGRAARMGAKTIIYTDIAADGMLGGPDAEGGSGAMRGRGLRCDRVWGHCQRGTYFETQKAERAQPGWRDCRQGALRRQGDLERTDGMNALSSS